MYSEHRITLLVLQSATRTNPGAYNAMTSYFYAVFFFCSFYFYSCSSLLPLFFGLDVNVPLEKVRLLFFSSNLVLLALC